MIMGQLRDSQTSELIAEGDPVEVALIAETLGATNVIFDDVGPGFNPAAAIQAHKDRITQLTAAQNVPKQAEQDARLAERNAVTRTGPAEQAMRAARAKVTKRNP